MRSNRHLGGLAAAMMFSMVAGMDAVPLPPSMRGTNGTTPGRRIDIIDRNRRAAQQQEIAEWNADVDRRKAEKKARRHGHTTPASQEGARTDVGGGAA